MSTHVRSSIMGMTLEFCVHRNGVSSAGLSFSFTIISLDTLGIFRCFIGMHAFHDSHTGKYIRRFAGIYAYCRNFIERKR